MGDDHQMSERDMRRVDSVLGVVSSEGSDSWTFLVSASLRLHSVAFWRVLYQWFIHMAYCMLIEEKRVV